MKKGIMIHDVSRAVCVRNFPIEENNGLLEYFALINCGHSTKKASTNPMCGEEKTASLHLYSSY